jgi:hypothetical protein
MWGNGPEKVEKKNTVAHSTSDVTPRKKKSVIRPGYYMRGLPEYLYFSKKSKNSYLIAKTTFEPESQYYFRQGIRLKILKS